MLLKQNVNTVNQKNNILEINLCFANVVSVSTLQQQRNIQRNMGNMMIDIEYIKIIQASGCRKHMHMMF